MCSNVHFVIQNIFSASGSFQSYVLVFRIRHNVKQYYRNSLNIKIFMLRYSYLNSTSILQTTKFLCSYRSIDRMGQSPKVNHAKRLTKTMKE